MHSYRQPPNHFNTRNLYLFTFYAHTDKHEVQMQNGETRDTGLLMDANLTSCVGIPKAMENGRYLKVRFPWPVLGSENHSFIAMVTGKNIQCTGANSLQLYTPPEGAQQHHPVFVGRYRKCEYVNEDVLDAKRVRCDYRCSCGKDVCSAVYLFALNKDDCDGQELCEVSFS